jgi:SPP1 family predicted phage head-tail adaptor
MNAGSLDRQIQFQRATSADDGYGMVTTWADHGCLQWAKKTDASDGERWRASEVSAIITTRFVVRYSEFTRDISPKDRLTCEGFSYEISGIKEIDGRRRWLEITAAARSDL